MSAAGAGVLGWSDLAGLRVGVWGVGVEGAATLRRLAADGITAAAVVDISAGSVEGREVLAFSEGGREALAACQVIIKSPGISPYDPPAAALAAGGARFAGGLGLWLADARPDRVLCVTGTKGKSTAASIAGSLVSGLGHRCLVGGNLGSPPWDPEAPAADWTVLEVSSYQAHDIAAGPEVVAVTSLSQDHLSWHHGYRNYVADKLSLCSLPQVRAVVVPAGDPELEQHADLLGAHAERVADEDAPWVAGLGLIGAHNRRNALVARRALERLGVPGASDDAAVAAAAAGYRPLPSRLTRVGAIGDVEFVDDSLSTNTLPTLAAVAAFPERRVALLAGGHDRGIDYAPLAAGLAQRAAALLVVTLPDNGPRIAAALSRLAPAVRTQPAGDMDEAVRAAWEWARPDGVVLLSPAAPSFGHYRDYADRADAFTGAMRRIAGT